MKRSGQVKPSKAMSARRRTVLEPPSLPIRYLPRSVSVSPAALVTVASTSSAVCASPVSFVENRTSPSPLALMCGSAACTSLYCSHCNTYGYGTSPLSRLMSNTAINLPVARSRKWNSGASMPPVGAVENISFSSPSSTSMSTVGGWMVAAR